MRTIYYLTIALSGVLFTTQSCAPADKKQKDQEDSYPLVKLEEAARKKFVHKIQVQGNVETEQDVLLSAEMGGLIVSIDVREGQKVSKGQVIATIDASVLSSNLQELRTQLDYAQYVLGKQEELSKRGVGSEFELESAKSNVNALKASIESLSTQRGKSVIRAPFTGVIDQVFAKQGQMAGPATQIARLVNNNEVDIVAGISEKHFAKVKVGTAMEVRFPNYSDTMIRLQVTNVGNYIEPTNRTFRIKSSIRKNDYLLPNMLAEVSISDMEIDNGLVIPSEAVLKDQNNQDFVFIAQKKGDGTYLVKKAVINVIDKYEGDCLIEENELVKEGVNIVVEGARGVVEGETVRNK